ncbi:MAG: hypothetical protein J6A11_01170 [Lachnospiraceae bacterium]|nr:hypothetical protein [Lachnospiraceae bacterium]
MLIQGIQLRKNTLNIYLLTTLIGFAFGSILLLVMSILFNAGIIKDNEYTVAVVGTLMSLILFFAVYVFWGMSELNTNFNKFIGFGMTRKKFFLQELFSSYAFIGISMLAIFVLYYIELAILKIPFYRQFVYEELFTSKVLMLVLLCVVICAPILRMFLGSLLLKYGNSKGFWIIWALWMVGCMAPGYIQDTILREGPRNGMEEVVLRMVMAVRGVPKAVWIVIGFAVLAVFLIISWQMIRKKAVE